MICLFFGKKNSRPKIEISIRKIDRDQWRNFRKYHYLNHCLHKSSDCYGAFIGDKLIAFCAVIHFPHPKTKLFKRIHRLVVLPDYQGIGIGTRLLTAVAKLHKNKGYRPIITTSTPALLYSLKKDKNWKLKRFGRLGVHGGIKDWNSSFNRYTTSWEFSLD